MKRKFYKLRVVLILSLTNFLISASALGQSPEKMSYQAVIRDASDNLIVNQTVNMKISILQNSSLGSSVYTETHAPTTNDNGLVSIEIGDGTVVNGDFLVIDWATGPYFIKTEIDITGGTNYSITSTSQLVSVPYALYAKTAGSTNSITAHYAGELYGGGIVFWVDQTGQHGLIVSMVDISNSQKWSNISDVIIGTTNDWDGANNTIAIIGQTGHTSSAAKICEDYVNADYGTGVYNDWYLPSIAELNHIWNNFYEVQKTLNNSSSLAATPLVRTYYWSSSEHNYSHAWSLYFNLGNVAMNHKGNITYIRAVRAF